MTDKVIEVAVLVNGALTDTTHQKNHFIACQEAINVIKGFEIIQVEIKNTPRIYITELVIDGSHNL